MKSTVASRFAVDITPCSIKKSEIIVRSLKMFVRSLKIIVRSLKIIVSDQSVENLLRGLKSTPTIDALSFYQLFLSRAAYVV